MVIAEMPGLTDVDPIAGTDELLGASRRRGRPGGDTGQASARIDGEAMRPDR